jgi:hypothetical protein
VASVLEAGECGLVLYEKSLGGLKRVPVYPNAGGVCLLLLLLLLLWSELAKSRDQKNRRRCLGSARLESG